MSNFLLAPGAPSRTGNEDVIVFASDALIPVGRRPALSGYLAQLWRRREFIWAHAVSKLRVGYSQDRLGSAWLILTPIFTGLTYYFLFGVLLHTSRGISNFIGFLVIGVFLFQYSTRIIVEGARSISGNRRLIQALSFPRAALPFSVALRQAVAVGPAMLAMLAILLVTPPVEKLTWRIGLLFPVLVLQSVFSLGLALVFARLVARINDTVNLLNFLMRGWLYFSGVFYSFERFVGHPTLLALFEANPMYLFLTMARDSLLYATTPDTSTWLSATAWAILTLALGFLVFWRGEPEYGRV